MPKKQKGLQQLAESLFILRRSEKDYSSTNSTVCLFEERLRSCSFR